MGFYEERGNMGISHTYTFSFRLLIIIFSSTFQKGGNTMSRLESNFQAELKKDLRAMFNGCIVLKTDPTDTQGIPDLLVLYRDK